MTTDNRDIKPISSPEYTKRLARHGFGITDEDIEVMENDTAFQARRAAAVAAKHPDEVDAPTTEEVPNDTETGM